MQLSSFLLNLNHASSPRTAQFNPTQICLVQPGLAQLTSAQLSSSQLSCPYLPKLNATQIRPVQCCAAQLSSKGSAQPSSGQLTSPTQLIQLGPAQLGKPG